MDMRRTLRSDQIPRREANGFIWVEEMCNKELRNNKNNYDEIEQSVEIRQNQIFNIFTYGENSISTCLKVNDLMAIFCSERRDSGTKRTMKKTSRRATSVAKITTDSSLPGKLRHEVVMMMASMTWWGGSQLIHRFREGTMHDALNV